MDRTTYTNDYMHLLFGSNMCTAELSYYTPFFVVFYDDSFTQSFIFICSKISI